VHDWLQTEFGNGIYELLQNVTTRKISLSLIHTFCSSLQHAIYLLSLLCLHQSLSGNGFNAVGTSAFVFTNLLAGDCLLTNQTLDLSYLKYLGTERIENTAFNHPLLNHEAVHGPRREHLFPVSPLMRARNLLPSNGRCLQSHYLATGIHATIETICSFIHRPLYNMGGTKRNRL
jgi:hypothetical protein